MHKLTIKYRPSCLEDTGTDKPTRRMLRSMLARSALRVVIAGDSGSGKSALIRVLEHTYYGGPAPAGAVHRINAHDDKTVGRQRDELASFCRGRTKEMKMVVMDDAEQVAPALHQAMRSQIDAHGQNVMFVCACTQPQRVSRALRARLLAVQTRRLNESGMQELFRRVCAAENMHVSTDAEQYLLEASGRSARTLLQHLGKLLLHGGAVDLDLAQACCSSVHPSRLIKFTHACRIPDGGISAARELYSLFDSGHSVMDLLDAYFAHIKVTELDDDERFPIIRLIANGIKCFYDEQDDEIVLAVFAREMNKLLLGSRARHK